MKPIIIKESDSKLDKFVDFCCILFEVTTYILLILTKILEITAKMIAIALAIITGSSMVGKRKR